MNIQLIKKVIRSNNDSCPNFTYKNPLLDKNVARALSKSFVKILYISKQNSNLNNNLRVSILENIRRMCQIEPENHAKVDDSITELLTDFYKMQINDTTSSGEDSGDKDLEAFIVRKMKEINMNSSFESSVNPEIVQALINLNANGVYLETLSNDIIHWNITNELYTCLLKDIWSENNTTDFKEDRTFSDVSIKMKPEIEKILLESCLNVLTNTDAHIENMFTCNEALMDLIKSCALSADCFQICSGILNFLFIMTNFDKKVQNLITAFVKYVKINCPEVTFSVLYPLHISSTVVLLDFEINNMPSGMREEYIKFALKYLEQLHKKCESDLVLLLSHFPQWFDIYFKKED